MSETIDYYRQNAVSFFESTSVVDMSALYEPFLRHIPAGGLILDAGCGSGRDSKAFLNLGFRVRAFDAWPELVAPAKKHLGQGNAVEVRTFHEVQAEHCYDGVWACASLLHVPRAQLPEAMARLWRSLKPGGTFCASFRYGSGERAAGERHFTEADESQTEAWLEGLPGLATKVWWVTEDLRPEREDRWPNLVATWRKAEFRSLVTGGERAFLPHLCETIAKASEIDKAVAFVKITGLRLLPPDLQSALTERKARVRVLTSDYLDVTDPEALRLLMLLQREGAHVRVYQSAGSSFHLKAYLIRRMFKKLRVLVIPIRGRNNGEYNVVGRRRNVHGAGAKAVLGEYQNYFAPLSPSRPGPGMPESYRLVRYVLAGGLPSPNSDSSRAVTASSNCPAAWRASSASVRSGAYGAPG